MKLRTKFNLAIAATFALLAAVLGALQVRWADTLVIGQAADRMGQNIQAAWRMLGNRRERLAMSVRFLAESRWVGGYETLAPEERVRLFDRAVERWRLDAMALVDGEGRVLAARNPDVCLDLARRYCRGKEGEAISGIGVVSFDRLLSSSSDLAERCRPPRSRADGLFLFAAAPREGGGYVLGAMLLNGNFDVVDEIQRALFRDEFYKGRRFGTVTIFQGPVRIATTVLRDNGERAIGTTVSDEVAEQTLRRGEPWTGPALVVNARYLSRYDPIRDPDGNVVGMLYLGELERYYVDIKYRTLAIELAALLGVMALGLGAGLVMSGRVIRRVAALGEAARAFGEGNYAVRADVGADDEIGRLARAFNAMAERIEGDRNRILAQQREIEEANRNYINLLSFVTHELRSSLAAAMLNVDLLRDGTCGPLTADQKEGAETVARTLQHLNDITLNYLQLSRIEQGKILLNRAETRVRRDAIEPVLAELRARLRQAGMRVEVKVDDDVIVAADVNLLRIVYQNLLTNAVKFGRPGGEIVLGAERGDGRVVLSVRNEGRGIPSERMDAMFRKFAHYDGDTEAAKSGSGLGLFIIKQIIAQHGGEVWVESKEGEYACFKFTLLA